MRFKTFFRSYGLTAALLFASLFPLPASPGRPGMGAPISLVDVATDVTDPFNLPDTEPSIAVNPKNPKEIAIVTFSEGWAPNSSAPIWKSINGGATWTKVKQLPQPPTNLQGPGDQKIAFDADGKLYVAELDFGLNDFIYRQADASNANLTPGASYGDDQPHVDVDKSSNGSCFRQVYSPWLNFKVSPERSMSSKSVNSGISVNDVAAGDNSAFGDRTTRVALAPDGKAYIIYKTREGAVSTDFENAHFHVNRSDDCGVTWGALGPSGSLASGSNPVQTYFTENFGNPNKGPVSRARSSDAWIAVGPASGAVNAAYLSKDNSGFAQVYVAQSTDQGKTWRSSRVTDGTHNSAFPEVAVNANGFVGILYIDYDDSGVKTIFRHHFAVSPAGGGTWSDQVLQSMDPNGLSNTINGFIWGDYEGLTAVGDTFYGVFTGQSVGRSTPQLDPIFFKSAYPISKSWILKWIAESAIVKVPPPWPCLQCPPVPYYNIFIDGDPSFWSVRLTAPGKVDLGQKQIRTPAGTVISFRGQGVNLESLRLRFERGESAKVGESYKVKIRVEASASPLGGVKSNQEQEQ